MPQVKQFDTARAREDLKRCPKTVRTFFKLTEDAYERQRELTGLAISRLRSLPPDATAVISRLINAFSFDKGREGEDLAEQNSALKEAQAFLDKMNVGK